MARDESDRENLLREATALVERIELSPVGGGEDEHIVAGFRTNGAASFFFGADPVYQFNAAGELRRAFVDGRLIKASGGRLVSLSRKRLANETEMLSRELSDAEQSDFAASMCSRLRKLADELEVRHYRIIGQVPADADIVGRLRGWLAVHDNCAIANSPRADA